MLDKLLENKVAMYITLCVCAIFTFGGAVNLGMSGFTFACPFMVLAAFLAHQGGKQYIIFSIVILLAILPFYILKKMNSPIFYPAVGREIILNLDACFITYQNKYTPPYKNYILVSRLENEQRCREEYKAFGDALSSYPVPKGNIYKITKTPTEGMDLGSVLNIYADDNGTEIFIPPENYDLINTPTEIKDPIFVYTDATLITKKSLQNPIFYYASSLMNWPFVPMIILNTFFDFLTGIGK